MTCFILDINMPGISIGKKEDKLGIRCSSTCAVHFDNVRVSQCHFQGYRIRLTQFAQNLKDFMSVSRYRRQVCWDKLDKATNMQLVC